MNSNDSASAKAHVMDRMMFLLEERSVSNLASQDPQFAQIVGELYQSVQGHARSLRTPRDHRVTQ